MAHKPEGLFETPAGDAEKATQATDTDGSAAEEAQLQLLRLYLDKFQPTKLQEAQQSPKRWARRASKPQQPSVSAPWADPTSPAMCSNAAVEEEPPDWSPDDAGAEPGPEQDTTTRLHGVEQGIETMTKMAGRMQDAGRVASQEAQASLELLATGNKDASSRIQNSPETPQAQEAQGMHEPSREGMKPHENQHKDVRLKGSRYGADWEDDAPGAASKEGAELDAVIDGSPPRHLHQANLGYGPTLHQQYRWLRAGCRSAGVHGLDQQPLLAATNLHNTTQTKIGVLVNLHQSRGFKAKEGGAPVADSMKSV